MLIFVQCVTVIGIIAAICFGVNTVRTNNALRRAELITKIYRAFTEDKLFQFYDRIRKGDAIEWEKPDSDDERLLNRSLTLFDEIDYWRSQGLLQEGEAAWEYFASEIQYFATGKQ